MATEGTPIPDAASDKTAAQPPVMPGPLALLTATALGSFIGSRVGGKPLAVAAGATALAWLNLKRKTPAGAPAAAASTPTPTPAPPPPPVAVPREPEVDPRVQEWLARQIERENRAEVAELTLPESAVEALPTAPVEPRVSFAPEPSAPGPVIGPAPVVEAMPAPQPADTAAEPEEEDNYRPEPLLPDSPGGHMWEAESYAALTEPTPHRVVAPFDPAPPPAAFEAPVLAVIPSTAVPPGVFQAPLTAPLSPLAPPAGASQAPPLGATPLFAPPSVLFEAPPTAPLLSAGPPAPASPIVAMPHSALPPMVFPEPSLAGVAEFSAQQAAVFQEPSPPPVFPEPILLREPPKPVFSTFKSAAAFPPPPVVPTNTSPIPGIEPLPSWNETAAPTPMVSDPATDVDLEALFDMPAFQGGILPNEIAVVQPPNEEATTTSAPSQPAPPVPEADPMAAFFQAPPPATPSAEADARPTQAPEIAVHVAAAGEAWFESPLADVPNPWQPAQGDDAAFAPPSFTPPPASSPASAPAPVVEAEIVLRPRAPVQASVVSKSMPPAKPPVIDQEAEAAEAQEGLPQAPVQSPREQRARPTWRSWFRGD